MSSLLSHVADRFLNTPLLLDSRKAAVIAAAIGERVGLDAGSIDALAKSVRPLSSMERAPGQSGADYQKTSTGVAIITIVGTLLSRSSHLDALSGLVGYDYLKRQVRAAANDTSVTSILLDFHSPGGEALGAFEAADVVHQVAQRKPVVAVANGLCCSAAYALAAAANKIVIIPSGIVGSVGVVWLHIDTSAQLQQQGVKPTFLYAGERKTVGNQLEPLDEQDTAEIQAEIDALYRLFLGSVAAHRPKLTEAALRATQARVFMGADAVTVGLADQVGSFEGVVAELGKLHGPAVKPFDRTEALYGKITAEHERLAAAHTAGVRAGMAAAIAGRTL